MKSIFNKKTELKPFFDGEKKRFNNTKKVSNGFLANKNRIEKVKIFEKSLDVSDKEKWSKTNMLLEAFGGTLEEMKEN